MLDEGKIPAFSQPYEEPPIITKDLNGGEGIPSSVWKSDPSDQDPSVTLWFKDGKQSVAAVLITTMNQQDGNESDNIQTIDNPNMKDHLLGALVEICTDGEDCQECGTVEEITSKK